MATAWRPRSGLPPDAILFDLDGTLYRQAPVRAAMVARIVRAHWSRPGEGLRVVRAIRRYRRCQEELRGAVPDWADLGEEQLRRACGGGRPDEVVRASVSRWFEREPLDLLEAATRPGLRPLLAAARERGTRLAVCSDYPAARKLQAMGIAHFFDVVVCAQDPEVQRFKPDPRVLRCALSRLGVRPERALYVGDRADVDAAAAAAAQIPCVLVGSRRSRRPSMVARVADFQELADVLYGTRGPGRPAPR